MHLTVLLIMINAPHLIPAGGGRQAGVGAIEHTHGHQAGHQLVVQLQREQRQHGDGRQAQPRWSPL